MITAIVVTTAGLTISARNKGGHFYNKIILGNWSVVTLLSHPWNFILQILNMIQFTNTCMNKVCFGALSCQCHV